MSGVKGYKYLILISDGGAFSWYDKTTGKTWAKFYAIADKAATDESDVYYWCNPYDFQLKYVDSKIGYTDEQFKQLMKMNSEDVDENSIPRQEAWKATSVKYNKVQYQGAYTPKEIKTVLDAYPNTCA